MILQRSLMEKDTMMREVTLGDFPGGGAQPHFLIAGPCVIESEQIVLDTAFQVAEIAQSVGFPYLFKSSYDKANRSSHSFLPGAWDSRRPGHSPKSERTGSRTRPDGRSQC